MTEKAKPLTKPRRFVPTVRQYQEDRAELQAAGPNALLRAVLTGGAQQRPKPAK